MTTVFQGTLKVGDLGQSGAAPIRQAMPMCCGADILSGWVWPQRDGTRLRQCENDLRYYQQLIKNSPQYTKHYSPNIARLQKEIGEIKSRMADGKEVDVAEIVKANLKNFMDKSAVGASFTAVSKAQFDQGFGQVFSDLGWTLIPVGNPVHNGAIFYMAYWVRTPVSSGNRSLVANIKAGINFVDLTTIPPTEAPKTKAPVPRRKKASEILLTNT